MSFTTPGFGWTTHIAPGASSEAPDLLEDGSLPGRWLRRWLQRPGVPQLAGSDGRWITAEELATRSASAAARLRGAGLSPGDRVALSADTSADFVIAYVAALRAGLVVVPLNTAYTQAEVHRIVQDARPAAAVVDRDDCARWIDHASEGPIPILGVELDVPEPASAESIDSVGPDHPALLVYTSGTTGQPKGAMLTHGNLLSSATAVNLAWRWEPEDRLLLTLPLFHLHGLGVGINGSLCAGAAIALRERFNVADVAEQCRGQPTLFFGVPAMYQRLARAGRLPALRNLRLLVSGSAPLPAPLAAEVALQCGQMPLERYGMTETMMLTSNPYAGVRKPGTVGVPLPGVEVRLADADADAGEVEVRGPNVIDRYYGRPEASAEAFTSDGWFRTGDLGAFDTDGYLRLVGRSKELIITGGYNVHPREVEEALATHPDVEEVAVVGRPSAAWGEEVTAVVVARRPVPVDTLRAHAALTLAPHKVPKRVEFAEQLPRNALGKLLRGAV